MHNVLIPHKAFLHKAVHLPPSLYHHVLVSALYRIITQPRLAWWPQIDMLYR